MRFAVALAILLVGVKGAAPASIDQNSPFSATAHSFVSAPEYKGSNGDASGASVLTARSESSDAPHDQGEAAAEPPPSPAPASTDLNATAKSLGELCNALLISAQNYQLPVSFFANLIWQESRLQLDAVSRVGALGIAQFMPEVALEVGLGDPFDPRQAIPASARFLHGLRQHFGNLGLAAAAYNAGAHRVADWLHHRRALPRETRTYVVRVTGRSLEAWRKSPVDDSQLTFARPLPCRQLPAFADLEQAQSPATQAEGAAQEPRPQRQKIAAKPAAKAAASAGKKIAQTIDQKVARRIAQNTEKKTPVARQRVAERKQAAKAAGAEIIDKIARIVQGTPHATARPQRGPHDKRRDAQAS